MRRAIIDIGTNTVKVLVADISGGQVVPILAKDRTTRLGEKVDDNKKLLPAAIERTVQAIQDFLAEGRALGVVDFRALTTSAARDAVNREEFFDRVRGVCGLEVELISGEREAELIFRGVSSDPEWSGKRILVVDVGGGSAEFIQGRGGVVERLRSLPLGALRLTEKFGEGRFEELCEYLRTTLGEALAGHEAGRCRLIATGGTVVTLARVECGVADHGTISREKLEALLRRLGAMPLAERKKVPGLPAERADIIVCGGAVILTAMDVLDASELTVSVRNLRYGALVSE
ncbi:MAG TPA: Ppx/GppA phosphatase family protein [Verrucomicrobiae bacterium]|nr:Ppx/GppA phosphatase family protein [Verrucomicrobiae bacterium]